MLQSAEQESALRVSNAVAAGQTTINSSAVDLAGYEGVKFYVAFGALVSGAVTAVKAQQSSDNASSDAYADLEGTGITVADDDDNKIAILDVKKSRERYVRCTVTRSTQNATVDGIIAVRYGAKKLPATDDATTVISREVHASPAEGTA